MHFLATQETDLATLGTACDLQQSAGDIIFLSAADSELAVLARAQNFLLKGDKVDNGKSAKSLAGKAKLIQPPNNNHHNLDQALTLGVPCYRDKMATIDQSVCGSL